jgi:hypothetical protein
MRVDMPIHMKTTMINPFKGAFSSVKRIVAPMSCEEDSYFRLKRTMMCMAEVKRE